MMSKVPFAFGVMPHALWKVCRKRGGGAAAAALPRTTAVFTVQGMNCVACVHKVAARRPPPRRLASLVKSRARMSAPTGHVGCARGAIGADCRVSPRGTALRDGPERAQRPWHRPYGMARGMQRTTWRRGMVGLGFHRQAVVSNLAHCSYPSQHSALCATITVAVILRSLVSQQ